MLFVFFFFFPFRPILNFSGLPREIKGFPHFPLLVLRKTSLIDSFAHQLVVTKLMFVIWSVKVINTLTQVNWPVSISSLTFSYIVDHILLGCLHLIRPMNFIMKTDKKKRDNKIGKSTPEFLLRFRAVKSDDAKIHICKQVPYHPKNLNALSPNWLSHFSL